MSRNIDISEIADECGSINRCAEHSLKKETQIIGLVGIIFGNRENAALYLTCSVLVICLFFLSVIMIIDDDLRSEITTTVGAIGVAVLGFIGGLLKK